MKVNWNGNFQENIFKNLGIPHKVALFSGIYANSQFLLSTSIVPASSFGCDHNSELDISCMQGWRAFDKRNTLEPFYLIYVGKYWLQLNS